MSNVFLSYKREDEARVERLQAALVAAGLSVWWDRNTTGGGEWRQEIGDQLRSAHVVIVVWSETSTGKAGTFVRDEARRGLDRGVLVPVRIDPVDPPVGFGEFQALDLVGWRGGRADARFADVLAAVQALIRKEPAPVRRWPSVRRRRNRLVLSAFALVGAVLTGLALPTTRCTLCRLSVLGALCHGTGITRIERTAWERRSETLSETVAPNDTFDTEQAARANAQARGDDYARKIVCEPYTKADWQLVSATARASEWHCSAAPAGFRCGFTGSALCDVKMKVLTTGDACE